MAISNIGPSWTLGDRLAKARREAGIQAQEMADIFDVSRNSISAWEHDTVEVKASTVRRWAEVTGVSPAWLLDVDHDGDGRGPRRAPTAGAAALAIPRHTADTDDTNEKDARGRVSEKMSPSLLVTLSRAGVADAGENGSKDPCRNTSCQAHHAAEGKAA